MIYITYEKALAVATEIVAAAPEGFVYDKGLTGSCDYVRDGKASCLAGQVLNKLGVTLEQLKKYETRGIGAVLEGEEDRGLLDYDFKSRRFLVNLQAEQDSGTTWTTALVDAMHEAEFLGF